MAEALGWDGVDRPARTVCGNREPRWAFPGGERTGWTLHTNRDQRPNGDRLTVAVDRPAPSVTGKSGGQWVLRSGQSVEGTGRAIRDLSEPAVTVTSSVDDCRWTFVNGNQPHAARRGPHEPAPTIHFGHNPNEVTWVVERPAATDQGDSRIGRPGHKGQERGGESQFAEQSVRVTVREAAILQGFAPDYPWQGTKTKQFEAVGNAVPPPLATAVIGALTHA